ncbi:MAG: glycosyltransferase family 2 protein [Thermoanaerobaculia bacterium]|nr:glycosyltransferase family 2 protein [Thermoanaerobaculia bacterium]
MPEPIELSLVVPAWNEAAAIAAVAAEWRAALDGLGLAWEIRLYDDGSTDGTAAALAPLAAADPRLVVTRQANRGHGPTILRGFREARGRWIAQADGDGEIPAAAFPDLWRAREGADLVLGARQGRPQSLSRRLLSRGARLAVRLVAGGAPADVNCPFRLYRSEPFADLFARLEENSAVPNVALTALAVARGLSLREVPVPFAGRRAGQSSLAAGRALRLAAAAAAEILRLRRAPAAP